MATPEGETTEGPSKPITEWCKHFHSPGGCQRAKYCTFAHTLEDFRKPYRVHSAARATSHKMVLCRYFDRDGRCRDDCQFAHGHGEMGKLKKGSVGSGPADQPLTEPAPAAAAELQKEIPRAGWRTVVVPDSSGVLRCVLEKWQWSEKDVGWRCLHSPGPLAPESKTASPVAAAAAAEASRSQFTEPTASLRQRWLWRRWWPADPKTAHPVVALAVAVAVVAAMSSQSQRRRSM